MGPRPQDGDAGAQRRFEGQGMAIDIPQGVSVVPPDPIGAVPERELPPPPPQEPVTPEWTLTKARRLHEVMSGRITRLDQRIEDAEDEEQRHYLRMLRTSSQARLERLEGQIESLEEEVRAGGGDPDALGEGEGPAPESRAP